jgi:hypothetical protein
MKTKLLIILACLLILRTQAQNILFDFENAPRYSPLPINLTMDGITAHFSATGQGYSIQLATVQGLNPAGFSGNCIYPSSIYAADLIVSFSTPLTDFSILYAPEEYACDSSATMRATAYLGSALIGTATTNAQAGTWPTETLRFTSAQVFDKVVVHYDQPPVTGGDWGPVFMADNMAVTPAPPPPTLWISLTASNYVKLNWPVSYSGFTLQQNPDPATTNWVNVTSIVSIVGTRYEANIQKTNSALFFRLKY